MTYHCTCGSPVSQDDTTCPHCGKPFGTEQAQEQPEAEEQPAKQEQPDYDPWVPRHILNGALLYTVLIPASIAVIVHDLVGAASVSAVLISFGVSLWAGFLSVTLFHWKYPSVLDVVLARGLGMLAGLVISLIETVFRMFGVPTEYLDDYLVLSNAYIETIPVVIRMSSSLDPELASSLVLQISLLTGCILHALTATVGGLVAIAIYRRRRKD